MFFGKQNKLDGQSLRCGSGRCPVLKLVYRNEKSRPERLACLVDYYDKLSNFMRALLALESFSNSIRMDEMKDSLI